MTATTITDPTTRPATRHRTAAPAPRGEATLLQRWTAGRRRRQYLVAKQRHDRRDRSDRYLDRIDDMHQRQALVAFTQR
ncbi:hypothetical protein ACI8AF_18255 [Blastococcus sp. SYSU D00669]